MRRLETTEILVHFCLALFRSKHSSRSLRSKVGIVSDNKTHKITITDGPSSQDEAEVVRSPYAPRPNPRPLLLPQSEFRPSLLVLPSLPPLSFSWLLVTVVALTFLLSFPLPRPADLFRSLNTRSRPSRPRRCHSSGLKLRLGSETLTPLT